MNAPAIVWNSLKWPFLTKMGISAYEVKFASANAQACLLGRIRHIWTTHVRILQVWLYTGKMECPNKF